MSLPGVCKTRSVILVLYAFENKRTDGILVEKRAIMIQARRNEIDIGGAANKADCTGLRENFCSTTPFRLLESNLAIQIAIFNG